MTTSSKKLSDLARQLNLLPYFSRHQGRTLMEAAIDLGQSPQQIMEDLNRLWMCGLPGLLPGDLVELDHSYKEVRIQNAQGMDKPLRLTPTEAGVLLLTLESLESLPGFAKQDAVISAAQKLRDIMGEYSSAVFDSTGADAGAEVLAVIRDAMDKHLKLSFSYNSHKSDSTSTRTVSPQHIFTHEGETYINAWDDTAGDTRTFRIDRIHDIKLLDIPAKRTTRDAYVSAEDPFEFAHATDKVTFQLREDALWLADYTTMSFVETATGKPQQFRDSDGHVWYTMQSPLLSKEWFLRFAIGHAENLKITEPEDLRNSLKQKVSHGLSAYDSPVE